MENVLKQAREKLKLSEMELAFIVDVTEQTVRANENGENIKITSKLLKFLTEQGFDREELEKEYSKYRKWKKTQVLQRLKAQ
ncbi:hypothetical protein [Priestia megaterium]|uniref:hypothetical protein n=1 Tax=Priestia megaterium TaxID=1404 RepID=UPI001ADF4E96|nr:hypothetical protein [Priestia megaterium]